MTNHHKEQPFAEDPQKIKEAGKKGGTSVNVKVDRAEKARVGGQHSHGGARTGKGD
ncbi:general stress protein [Pseudomonas moraviensis subsp. stanleyae]|uniref:general stress protein n=1 Tax=Pseudomonas moraviensis TaxID=321662 RepID=UPI002E371B4C|nr:general stress protein [Pseudomonas moraviensis]MED7670592.1 general stress protein [Pseudomonas moraviensis subsp. stanleyae]